MRTLNRFVIPLLSAGWTAGLVAACGGGGGGSDTSPAAREPLALNATNGQRMAAAVVADGDDLADDDDSGFFLPQPLTAGGGIQPCRNGGTYTLVRGTPLRFGFNNCRQAGVVQNGGFTLQVLAVEGDIDSPTSDSVFTAALGFDGLTVTSNTETFVFEGGGYNATRRYIASETLTTTTVSGSDLRFANDEAMARITAFDIVATTVSATSRHSLRYNLGYDDISFAGTVAVRTDLPLRNLEGFPPDSGKLTIIGANNTKVAVEATGGGTARISIDANGDGDFTDSGDRVINGQWTTFFG